MRFTYPRVYSHQNQKGTEMIHILLCSNPHFACLAASQKKVKVVGLVTKSFVVLNFHIFLQVAHCRRSIKARKQTKILREKHKEIRNKC